jgi:hypothetical protein
MIKKGKKKDYELDILEAKFEIAKLKWAEAGELKEIKKNVEKECTT